MELQQALAAVRDATSQVRASDTGQWYYYIHEVGKEARSQILQSCFLLLLPRKPVFSTVQIYCMVINRRSTATLLVLCLGKWTENSTEVYLYFHSSANHYAVV